MKKTVRKIIASTLCVTLLSASAPFVPLALAVKTTASNKIPVVETADTVDEGQPDIKAKVNDILHPQKETFSTIPSDHAYIPKDTILTVELTETINSKKTKEGTVVPLVLKENLIVNDVVVVPAGSEVVGVVTKARKNGFFGRSGKLEFEIKSVKTINGIRIPLQFVTEKKAGGDGGVIAVAAAVSVLGGFLMKGKNVEFKEGTTFEARVTADTDLNTTLDGLAEAMNPEKPHGTVIVIKK